MNSYIISTSCHRLRRSKFSQVSALLIWLCDVTVELTFENFCMAAALYWYNLARRYAFVGLEILKRKKFSQVSALLDGRRVMTIELTFEKFWKAAALYKYKLGNKYAFVGLEVVKRKNFQKASRYLTDYVCRAERRADFWCIMTFDVSWLLMYYDTSKV